MIKQNSGKSIDNNNKGVLPGDRLAAIEEFEGGKNTYLTPDGNVRSAVLGTKVYDLKRRVVKMDQKNVPLMPKVGDVVVGYVDMLFSSMLSVKILYINDRKSNAGFSAIASAKVGGRDRGDRGDRRWGGGRAIFRIGDIVRGRVVSLLNSTIHLTIAEKEFGVLYTACFNCGGDTVRINDAIKCVECGAYEERKLTNDYGKETIKSVYRTAKNNSK